MGGKFYMRKHLLKLLPPHHTYVEVFGGGAQLLFAKPPSPVEVYNDIDGELVNFFRVLRDPKKFKRFYRLVCLTPYSRAEYYHCRQTWQQCKDEVERAYRWFVVNWMGFGTKGAKETWRYSVIGSKRNMSASVSAWLSCIERLPDCHARLARVQIDNRDFRDILRIYDTPETLFYCDPPYVSDTYVASREYAYTMTLDDHRDLVDLLLRIKGMALLSGYRHPIYEPLEQAGWQRLDFQVTLRMYATKCNRGKRCPTRTESVWVSPTAWERLRKGAPTKRFNARQR